MTRPNEKFLNFLRSKNVQFFILQEEDWNPSVAFGYKSPGFIDDGWHLDPEKDKDIWTDVDQYGESDEFMDGVGELLSHPAIGYELSSCQYEIEEEDIGELEDYLIGLGFSRGCPAWMEEDDTNE